MLKIACKRLIDLREEKDYTQTKVAKAIYIAQRTYSHYEKGTRSIPIEAFIKLADFYNTSVDYIIGRTDKR